MDTILVDPEDAHLLSDHRWTIQGNKSGQQYARTTIHGKTILLHRLIANARPTQQVDHNDHNGLNNHRNNLRVATPAQNRHNQRLRRDARSGYKGVCPSGQHSTRWRAYITIEGVRTHLGTHPTREEAARAYDTRATDAFGAFALTNAALGLLGGTSGTNGHE